MAISIEFTEEEAAQIRKYAERKKMSVSELFRQTVLERIEDEFDLTAYEKAIDDYRNHPITYSHEEVVKILSDERSILLSIESR